MNQTQIKGLTTELQCQLFFTKKGYNVSIPLAQDCRYDMILDLDHTLYKIQIKTCRPTNTLNGGIVFNTVSSRMNHTEGNMKKNYTNEDVNFFATSYEGQVYLIPIELCQGGEKRLVKQYAQSANKKADLMSDYEADKVISRIKNKEPLVVKADTGINKVYQYSLDGVYMKTYNFYSDAARALGKSPQGAVTHIGEVVKGIRKSSYGFIWKGEKD